MARTRSIKPGFFKNEVLGELPHQDSLLFIGLWMLADREGRLEDRPKRIKIEIFPYREVDVEASLHRLARHGFILRYGPGYIQVINFHRHQSPHYKELPSEIPSPPNKINELNDKPIIDQSSTDDQSIMDNPAALVSGLLVSGLPSTRITDDSDIASLAESLHARHPSNGCGKGEIETLLRKIVAKQKPDARESTLQLIDHNHAAWCGTDNWNRGFAKGLANWLAPTMSRWKDPPPIERVAARVKTVYEEGMDYLRS